MSSKLVVLLIVALLNYGELVKSEEQTYTNTWAVEIPGGIDIAKRVAAEHGYEIVRQVSQS